MAKLDPLTKMPNITLFSERCEQATAHADKGGTRLAVLFVDLNYFKNTNDAISHLTGDRVIQGAVAHVVRDEFNVILDDIYDEEEILAVADNMLTALSDAFQVDCKEILHQIALTSSHIR
jgi:diguanylate cyclase (GGDEF)-like protein